MHDLKTRSWSQITHSSSWWYCLVHWVSEMFNEGLIRLDLDVHALLIDWFCLALIDQQSQCHLGTSVGIYALNFAF